MVKTKKELLKEISINPISLSAFSGMIANQLIEQDLIFNNVNIVMTVSNALKVKEVIMEMVENGNDF